MRPLQYLIEFKFELRIVSPKIRSVILTSINLMRSQIGKSWVGVQLWSPLLLLSHMLRQRRRHCDRDKIDLQILIDLRVLSVTVNYSCLFRCRCLATCLHVTRDLLVSRPRLELGTPK
jgi:hypothetical protein